MCLLSGAIVVYQQCRGYPFILDGCPVGSIINITSAKVGFRGPGLKQCRPRANASCTRSIINDQEIVSCDGQRTCSLRSTILDYTRLIRLCNQSRDGNFVWIKYHCVHRKKHINTSWPSLNVFLYMARFTVLYLFIPCTYTYTFCEY